MTTLNHDDTTLITAAALDVVRRSGRPTDLFGVPLRLDGEIRRKEGYIVLTLRADVLVDNILMTRTERVRWTPDGEARCWQSLSESFATVLIAALKEGRRKPRSSRTAA